MPDRRVTDDLGYSYPIPDEGELLYDKELARLRHEARRLSERAPRRSLAREYAALADAAERVLGIRAMIREAEGRDAPVRYKDVEIEED